jgi:DNA primase
MIQDFVEIRSMTSLAAFCVSRGITLKRNGSSGGLAGLCPFHGEKTASFTVYPDNHAHCFGCGWHGDVIDLCAKLDSLTTVEAAKKLGGGVVSGTIVRPSTPEPTGKPYQLTEADIKRMANASHRLAADEKLIGRFCGKRTEWTPETIKGAALEGDLGYEDGKVLFWYRFGIKARWKDTEGKRVIRWICGGAYGECWRQSLMVRSTKCVYVAEGETDVLTLLSLGVEEPGESLVVGLAGASILPNPEPFAGRDVIIVEDADLAGSKAGERLVERLRPCAASVKRISAKEIGM